MSNSSSKAQALLADLFAKLEVDTSRWTYASTPELCAVVVPYERDDGLRDVMVHIQPNQRDVPRDILGCAIQIAGTQPAIEAKISQGGRVVFTGLKPTSYRLEIAQPVLDRVAADAAPVRIVVFVIGRAHV